jgi:hypothetical protein
MYTKKLALKIVILFLIFLKSVLFLFNISLHFTAKENIASKKGNKKISKRNVVSPKGVSKDSKESKEKKVFKKSSRKKARKRNHPVYVKKYKKNIKNHKQKLNQLNEKADLERKEKDKTSLGTMNKIRAEKREAFSKRTKKPFTLLSVKQKNYRRHQGPSYKKRASQREFLRVYRSTYYSFTEKYKEIRKPITIKNLSSGFDIATGIDKSEEPVKLLHEVLETDIGCNKKKPYLLHYDAKPLMIELGKLNRSDKVKYLNRLNNFLLFGSVQKTIEYVKSNTGF